MSIPTVNVAVRVHLADGQPAQGAVVTAELDRPEVDGGYIVPRRFEGLLNDQGEAVLALWPNARGSTASRYAVTVRVGAKQLLQVSAVVPQADVNLTDIAELPAYPGKSAGEAFNEVAQAAAAAALQAVVAAQDEVETARVERAAGVAAFNDLAQAAEAKVLQAVAAAQVEVENARLERVAAEEAINEVTTHLSAIAGQLARSNTIFITAHAFN